MGWSDTVYVEKLTEFSALLRQEGLAVGPQETADACAVLEVLDLTDRSTVRDALRAVYAKSPPGAGRLRQRLRRLLRQPGAEGGPLRPAAGRGGGAGPAAGGGGAGAAGGRQAHGPAGGPPGGLRHHAGGEAGVPAAAPGEVQGQSGAEPPALQQFHPLRLHALPAGAADDDGGRRRGQRGPGPGPGPAVPGHLPVQGRGHPPGHGPHRPGGPAAQRRAEQAPPPGRSQRPAGFQKDHPPRAGDRGQLLPAVLPPQAPPPPAAGGAVRRVRVHAPVHRVHPALPQVHGGGVRRLPDLPLLRGAA